MAKGFAGEIKLDVRDWTPDWNAYLAPKAPDGAPNVLIVLYGGTGLAAWSPYGGKISAAELPDGTSAVIIAWEYASAVRLRQTLAKAGAVLALHERIDPTEVSVAIDAIVVTDDR